MDEALVEGGRHVYMSTSCFHGDMVLEDGRTGHEYCRSEVGYRGSKLPSRCKFCDAPCICPCHARDTISAGPATH